jgi:hypothetical protein
MSYKLALDPKPAYLHAVATGENSRENVTRYLEELCRVCVAGGYSRLLIEERLTGPRLGTIDVFEIAAGERARAFGVLQAIAYVDLNAEGNRMEFAETVAVNRGVPVRVFSCVADAEKWLLEVESGGTEPNAPADADQARG